MNQESPYAAPESEVFNPDIQEFEQVRIMSAGQRIGRARFIAYNTAAYFILLLPVMIMAGIAGAQQSQPSEVFSGFLGLFVIVGYVALFVWGFIVARRRLHDLDHTGWMSLLFFVPIANLVLALYMLFAPGTKGPNRFGGRPSENTVGTWIMATIFPLIFVIGIVAAIALPAYQDYTQRVKASQSQSE